jgi:hypothetical protein
VVYQHDLHEALHHPAPRQAPERLHTVPDVHTLAHCDRQTDSSKSIHLFVYAPKRSTFPEDRAVMASETSFLASRSQLRWHLLYFIEFRCSQSVARGTTAITKKNEYTQTSSAEKLQDLWNKLN